jgi:hypothetical protein
MREENLLEGKVGGKSEKTRESLREMKQGRKNTGEKGLEKRERNVGRSERGREKKERTKIEEQVGGSVRGFRCRTRDITSIFP